MKFLHILGSVVAFHAVLFLLAGVLPGCRSTTRRSPSPVDTAVPQPSGPQVTYPGASSPVSSGESLISPVSENYATGSSELPAIRFNPTRPGNPAATSLTKPASSEVTPVSTYTVVLKDSLWSIARRFKISQAELAAANNLSLGATLRLGQKLIIPQKHTSTLAAETPRTIEGDTLTYEVRSGENLGQIAKRSGTTVAAIKKLNNLPSDNVRPGQKLILPAGEATASALASQPIKPAAIDPKTTVSHTVRSGESLDQIARRYGVRAGEIAAVNRIANPNKIPAGKVLTIPGVSSSLGASKAEASSATTPVYTPAATPLEPQPTSPLSPESSPFITPSSVSPISPVSPDNPPINPIEPSPISPGQ